MPIDSTALSLESLPGIVAGPVLRRLTRTSVSVWVSCGSPYPSTVERRRNAAPAEPICQPGKGTCQREHVVRAHELADLFRAA